MDKEEGDRNDRPYGYINQEQYQHAQNLIRDKLLNSSRANKSDSLEGCLIWCIILLAITLLIIAAIVYFISTYWPYLVVAGLVWISFAIYKKLPDEKKRQIKEYAIHNKPQAVAILCSVILLMGAFLFITTKHTNVASDTKEQTNIQETKIAEDTHPQQSNSTMGQNIKILGISKPKLLYSFNGKVDSEKIELKNGDVLKVTAKNNELLFTSADDAKVYYKCKAITAGMNSNAVCVPFEISEIQLSTEEWQVWTVTALSGGSSPINYGFWMIGYPKDGTVKEFVSPDVLTKQGMPMFDEKNNGHLIRLKYENDALNWQYLHEYWPEGVPHSQAKLVVDKQGSILWDDSAQGFILAK